MDEILVVVVKYLTKIVAFAVSLWLASVVWNWGVADFLGIDYYMTFAQAVVAGLWLRLFVA